ncbi:g11777 [Coccomyxa elongata]
MADARGLHKDQIQKAVKALLKHIEKQKGNSNDLLEEDELLYLAGYYVGQLQSGCQEWSPDSKNYRCS